MITADDIISILQIRPNMIDDGELDKYIKRYTLVIMSELGEWAKKDENLMNFARYIGELHRLTKLKSVLPTLKLRNKVFLVSTTIAQDPQVLRLTLMSASVDFGCPSHI